MGNAKPLYLRCEALQDQRVRAAAAVMCPCIKAQRMQFFIIVIGQLSLAAAG